MSDPETRPTIYGIETEYSCMVTLPGNIVYELVGSCHSPDVKLGLYKQPDNKGTASIPSAALVSALASLGLESSSAGFLSNGGRFYRDPSGPEYATPETTTAEEATHRSFDGDEIVLGVFEKLRKSEVVEGYQVNRRIVDHNRTSRGIHLNNITTMEADEPTNEVKQWLATLNVVKGAIFGSGGLLLDNRGKTAFHHSPRLSLTTSVAASYYSGYARRPLVRFPFKEDGDHARIETVTSDALNFAWPLRASLVLTNAVVSLIERGYGAYLPRLRNPVRAAEMVGRFGNTIEVSVFENDGTFKGRRPLEVMHDICETILWIHDTEGCLDAESQQVIGEIIDVSDRMTQDPFSVVKQVESVARLAGIQERMRKKHATIDSPQICRFDYLWDLLGGGIAEHLRKTNKAGWQGFSSEYSARETKRRMITPPKDTRASVRGALLASNPEASISDWSKLPQAGTSEPASTYIHPLETTL